MKKMSGNETRKKKKNRVQKVEKKRKKSCYRLIKGFNYNKVVTELEEYIRLYKLR